MTDQAPCFSPLLAQSYAPDLVFVRHSRALGA